MPWCPRSMELKNAAMQNGNEAIVLCCKMMYCGAHTGISADDANNLSGYFDFSRRFNLRHTFRLPLGTAFFATPDEVRFRVRSFSIYFPLFHRLLARSP